MTTIRDYLYDILKEFSRRLEDDNIQDQDAVDELIDDLVEEYKEYIKERFVG